MYLFFIALCLIIYESYSDSPLCVSNSSNCAKEIFNTEVNVHCDILVPINKSKCKDATFTKIENKLFNTDARQPQWLLFQVYDYLDMVSAINLTILDNNWTYLKFRYQLEDETICHCREFYVSGKTERKLISYSCPWFRGDSEGKTCVLEVETKSIHITRYRKYVYIIPRHKIDIFVYLDVTDLNNVIYYIQMINSRIAITHYVVEKHLENGDLLSSVDLHHTKNEYNILHSSMQDNQENFYITITPVNEAGEHKKTIYTPIIKINKEQYPFVLCMVTTGALLPFLIIASFVWRRYFKLRNEKSHTPVEITAELSNEVHHTLPHKRFPNSELDNLIIN